MKERPILFNGDMVRAILEDRKTQTRRPLRVQPFWVDSKVTGGHWMIKGYEGDECVFIGPFKPELEVKYGPGSCYAYSGCPYGLPGDRLWVREHWGYWGSLCSMKGRKQDCSKSAFYHADNTRASIPFKDFKTMMDAPPHQNYKLPKNWDEMDEYDKEFHKDNWLNDWWKRVKSIPSIHMPRWASRITLEVVSVRVERVQDISESDCEAEGLKLLQGGIRSEFAVLWDSINGKKYPWKDNPWVWVVEFKVDRQARGQRGRGKHSINRQ